MACSSGIMPPKRPNQFCLLHTGTPQVFASRTAHPASKPGGLRSSGVCQLTLLLSDKQQKQLCGVLYHYELQAPVSVPLHLAPKLCNQPQTKCHHALAHLSAPPIWGLFTCSSLVSPATEVYQRQSHSRGMDGQPPLSSHRIMCVGRDS